MEVRPTEVCHKEVRPNEIRPTKVRPPLKIYDTLPCVLIRERVLMKSNLFRLIRIEGDLVPWRFCILQFLVNYFFWREP